MNVIIFGAGSTGRGHLGVLLFENGIRDLTFIERSQPLANLLKQHRRYTVRYVYNNKPSRDQVVEGFQTLGTNESSAVADAVAKADVIITAVISANLPEVAALLSGGLANRRARGNNKPVNIIACENLDRASSLLKRQTYEGMEASLAGWCDTHAAFPDAMISRVVPVAEEDPLLLVAEDYNEWVVDRSAVLGVIPPTPCIEFVDNLDARLEKKLWIHNGGHATVAYTGFLYGHEYIHQALQDNRVASLGLATMDEIGNAIAHKHGFDRQEIKEYEHDLGERGAIAAMKDLIARVVRDPIRKLGLSDRLMAPAIYCSLNGLEHRNILRSIINVLRYYSPSDAQSVNMRSVIKEKGLERFLADEIGLAPYGALLNELLKLEKELYI